MSEKQSPPMAPWARPFWEAAKDHRLLLQYCPHCQQHIFYPRRSCPTCFAEDVEWVEASGRGKIYAYTVVRNNAPSSFLHDMPYIIAIVLLEEGVRMTTNIVECDPEAVRIDLPVQVTYEPLTDEIILPKFKPLTGSV